MRISDTSDLKILYEHDKIAYYAQEHCFYDPKYNLYYYEHGEQFDPNRFYNDIWFQNSKFTFNSGIPCYLPEQDPSRDSDRKPKRSQQKRRYSGEFTNFIVLGIMSTCKITHFNEGNHAYTNWSEQHPCHFAVKSLVENRCMYWNANLSGHCNCHVAYDHRLGNQIGDGLEHIDRIKERDEKREIENLPIDHHFEDAERVGVPELNTWYKADRLKLLKSDFDSSKTIFYDAQWDVFFNGNGKFLEDITTKRRKEKRDPEDFARTWQGKLSMEDIAQEWEAEVSSYSLVQDNSGVFSPLEIHEMLHEICKISKDRISVEWNLDEDPLDRMSDEFNKGFKK